MELPMLRLTVLVFLLLPMLAQARPAAEQWFSVLLDGRKIGSFVSSRSVQGEQVTTHQDLPDTVD